MKQVKFLLIGILFGAVLVKAEVISWYRIQEMFHFQSFHMYGIIGSAVVTGIISVQIIKRLKIKSIQGEEINLEKKPAQYKAHFLGGTVFGLGWAFTGACPGPIYALIGTGMTAFVVVLVSAIFGTWVYGMLKNKLPH